jgi:hypothetical protein
MLGIRWTIGDVSRRGFESLRLSIWGAWGIFGADADYWVCVNTISVDHARQLVGSVPEVVTWRAADSHLPGWKLAPLLPDTLAASLVDDSPERCLLAEDVVPGLGQFASVCEGRALNTGIRGLPAGFDLEQRLGVVLGEPAERVRARDWDQHRAELYQRVGIEPEPSELSVQGE